MNFRDHIDVLILTHNEGPNIGRILDALQSFPEIVVLDSGSTDETAEIVSNRSNTRLVTRPFDRHADQWNFGLTRCGLYRSWVLALDADYLVPNMSVSEIANLKPPQDVSGYRSSFRYCVFGRPLSGALYPPVTVLFRRERCYYEQFGHTQRLVVDGRVLDLSNRIYHDDRKPLSRWLASQQKYAALEADYLITTSKERLRRSDRMRLLAWPAPILVFVYTLFLKRCIWDGWPGWVYVLQRTLAEIIISLEILQHRWGQRY